MNKKPTYVIRWRETEEILHRNRHCTLGEIWHSHPDCVIDEYIDLSEEDIEIIVDWYDCVLQKEWQNSDMGRLDINHFDSWYNAALTIFANYQSDTPAPRFRSVLAAVEHLAEEAEGDGVAADNGVQRPSLRVVFIDKDIMMEVWRRFKMHRGL